METWAPTMIFRMDHSPRLLQEARPSDSVAIRRRSSAAGIAHHLTKPVDPDRLDRLLGGLGKPRATALRRAEEGAAAAPTVTSHDLAGECARGVRRETAEFA
jgi:hypothetical protein